MQNPFKLFQSVQMTAPKSSVFDLTHTHKLSCNPGELVPIMCEEVVPGDVFKISADALIRFAPLVAPVMHDLSASIHYFYVPYRILWPNWEKWITATDGDTTHVPPFFTLNTGNMASPNNRLANYLGIPPVSANSEKVSALFFAAYQAIWTEYYRDENLIPLTDPKDNYTLVNGDNSAQFNAGKLFCRLRLRAWEHDYFTAALPFAQKGNPVTLPISGFNDVPVRIKTVATTLTAAPSNVSVQLDTPVGLGSDTLFAKTSGLNVTATTINDLRRAYRLQEFLEKNARAGTRYVEFILAHFGVRSSDQRVERPEYIAGLKAPVVISEVLNTSDTATAPQGNMAGHAYAVAEGKAGTYRAEDYGCIIGILSVMPKPDYFQGVPKKFTKWTDQYSFYTPEFANIGEQAVQSREIYGFQAGTAGDVTFGYVPRYAEYKYSPNRVSGDFQTTLAFWTFVRNFGAAPVLNQSFIECVPRYDPFAVTNPAVHHLYCYIRNNVTAIRRMPKFGTPTW